MDGGAYAFLCNEYCAVSRCHRNGCNFVCQLTMRWVWYLRMRWGLAVVLKCAHINETRLGIDIEIFGLGNIVWCPSKNKCNISVEMCVTRSVLLFLVFSMAMAVYVHTNACLVITFMVWNIDIEIAHSDSVKFTNWVKPLIEGKPYPKT